MVLRIVFGLIAILCAACTSQSVESHKPPPLLEHASRAFSACYGLHGVNVLDEGRVICLHGDIDPTMFVSLLKRQNEITMSPFVVISSPGGQVNSSLDIVQMLNRYQPIPVVGDLCVSACAQFLFLMGSHRVLLHCGTVAFHGGPIPIETTLAKDESDRVRQITIEDTNRFLAFYKNEGISMNMLNHPPKYVQDDLKKGRVVFWQWSINDLTSFGVKGIISANEPTIRVPKDYLQSCQKYAIYRP